MLGNAGLRGDVDQAEDTESRVHADAHDILQARFALALQQVIHGAPHIGQVAEEVAHACLHERWRDLLVGRGDRLQGHLVDGVVELEHGAVIPFQRVARIGAGGASAHAGGDGHGQADTYQSALGLLVRLAHLLSFPSAALL
ncbi:hypothetical protein D3C72_1235530 [compost metagenome]